jgi:hypothetical protein
MPRSRERVCLEEGLKLDLNRLRRRGFVRPAYRGLPENAAFLLFVESVQAILAEEQQIFWRARERDDGAAQQPGSAAPAKEPKHA